MIGTLDPTKTLSHKMHCNAQSWNLGGPGPDHITYTVLYILHCYLLAHAHWLIVDNLSFEWSVETLSPREAKQQPSWEFLISEKFPGNELSLLYCWEYVECHHGDKGISCGLCLTLGRQYHDVSTPLSPSNTLKHSQHRCCHWAWWMRCVQNKSVGNFL